LKKQGFHPLSILFELLIPVNAELLPLDEGKKLYQAFLEGSHQTDDDEFYTQQIERCEDL
jgi:hypothetical protein